MGEQLYTCWVGSTIQDTRRVKDLLLPSSV